MKICMKCGKSEINPECAYCNWQDKTKNSRPTRQEMHDKMLREYNPEEVVCYQIEILVPEGTHSYIYSDTVPSDIVVKEQYGLFARVGNVSALMHIAQHKQILMDAKEFWSMK